MTAGVNSKNMQLGKNESRHWRQYYNGKIFSIYILGQLANRKLPTGSSPLGHPWLQIRIQKAEDSKELSTRGTGLSRFTGSRDYISHKYIFVCLNRTIVLRSLSSECAPKKFVFSSATSIVSQSEQLVNWKLPTGSSLQGHSCLQAISDCAIQLILTHNILNNDPAELLFNPIPHTEVKLTQYELKRCPRVIT